MSDTENWPGFDREKTAQALEADRLTDRRVRRTRQTLHETLMRLTVERGYDEITVAHIAAAPMSGDPPSTLTSPTKMTCCAALQAPCAAGVRGSGN